MSKSHTFVCLSHSTLMSKSHFTYVQITLHLCLNHAKLPSKSRQIDVQITQNLCPNHVKFMSMSRWCPDHADVQITICLCPSQANCYPNHSTICNCCQNHCSMTAIQAANPWSAPPKYRSQLPRRTVNIYLHLSIPVDINDVQPITPSPPIAIISYMVVIKGSYLRTYWRNKSCLFGIYIPPAATGSIGQCMQ
jgi:hypothetical protein